MRWCLNANTASVRTRKPTFWNGRSNRCNSGPPNGSSCYRHFAKRPSASPCGHCQRITHLSGLPSTTQSGAWTFQGRLEATIDCDNAQAILQPSRLSLSFEPFLENSSREYVTAAGLRQLKANNSHINFHRRSRFPHFQSAGTVHRYFVSDRPCRSKTSEPLRCVPQCLEDLLFAHVYWHDVFEQVI